MTTPASLLRHHLPGNVLTRVVLAKLSPPPLAGTVEVARSPELLPLSWRGTTWPRYPPLLPAQAAWPSLWRGVASRLLVGLRGRVGSAVGMCCPTAVA